MEKIPTGVYIFLLPPSMAELKKRLTGRGTEDEETVNRRLAAAGLEISRAKHYKYVVVNDEPNKAAEEIASIIAAEHCATARNESLLNEVTKE